MLAEMAAGTMDINHETLDAHARPAVAGYCQPSCEPGATSESMQCDAMHYRVLLRRGVPARSVLPAGTANVCYRRSMPSRTNGLALTGDGRCGNLRV